MKKVVGIIKRLRPLFKHAWFPIVLIFSISFLLVFIWFKNGSVMGTGESAVPFYNLGRYRELTKHVWNDANLGGYLGNTISSGPTYWVLSKIQDAGVPGFLIEAFIFGMLFCVSGTAVFLLSKELLPETKPRFLLLSVFYYWFNPISLVNVWNRFLYNYMFFWALLPLFLYFIVRGIKRKDLRYPLYASLSTTVLSYALSNPVFSLIICATAILTIAFFWFTEEEGRFFFLKYLLLTLISFFLFNIWWIGQYFSFIISSGYEDLVVTFFTEKGNLYTLNSLSEGLGRFINTFRLIHASYIEGGPRWARIYGYPPIVLLEYMVPIIALWTIYCHRKIRGVLFLAVGYLLALFLIKGNSSPFGILFEFVFLKLPIFQVFRNPFEKFGFLLALYTSLLVGYGVQKLNERMQPGKLKLSILTLISVLIVVIYGFPFWTGLIFTSNEGIGEDDLRSYEVNVPTYYRDANDWLNEKGGDFRFISFPLGGEGITYTWDKPFCGVELSSALFDVPNLSLNTTVPYYAEVVSNLERMLVGGKNLSKIAPLLNVRYILLREDINWKVREMRNPKIIKQILESNKTYNKEQQIGEHTFYSISQQPFSKIYVPKWGAKVGPKASIEDYLKVAGDETGYIYSNIASKAPSTEKVLIKPLKTSFIPKKKTYSFLHAFGSLLHARFLPDNSILYRLILLKEQIERSQVSTPEGPFVFDIAHLGKRMVELFRLAEKDADPRVINQSVNTYFENLESLKTNHGNELSSTPENRFWGMVIDEFNKQNVLLLEIQKVVNDRSSPMVQKAVTKFNEEMINMGVGTRNTLVINEDMQESDWWVYSFNVEEEGFYNILLDNNKWNDFYGDLPSSFNLQINDEIIQTKPILSGETISFGSFLFNEGDYELIFAQPESINMLEEVNNEYTLFSDSKSEQFFEVKNFDPFSYYEMSYNYWLKRGKSFKVIINYDNEPPAEFDQEYFKRIISFDTYDHGFKNDNFVFSPRPGASSMGISFIADPSNYCEQGNIIMGSSCQDTSYKRLFNKTTEVNLNNISLKRMFDNTLMLLKENTLTDVQEPTIRYEEINPAEYQVTVNNANGEYVLIFSELYNSGWQAFYEDGTRVSADKHFLANTYANGWVLEKTGNYKLILKFMPEHVYKTGKIVSLVSLIMSLIILGVGRIRRKRNENN